MTVYFLPGVGCDERLFGRLDLSGLNVVTLRWPDFRAEDTLRSIAQRMVPAVDANEAHVLVGVSMGGMVAQELAALTHPQKVILISSWTGPKEWPPFVRISARLGLSTFIRDWTMRLAWPLKRVIDRRAADIDALLWNMAKQQGAGQIRRGTQAILRWEGSPWKGTLVRIHGDKDIVTPLRFPVDHTVKGGQHVMVLTRAEEVTMLLRSALTS